MRIQLVFVVAAAVCLGVLGPCAEGTFWLLTSPPALPSLNLPDVCGTRVFVAENRTTLIAENRTTLIVEDLTTSEVGRFTDTPWPWVVRVGDWAVGVLLSQQHVVTLAHCLQNYTAWYGGFYNFDVKVGNGVIGVSRIQVQDSDGGMFPFALLTLKAKLAWIPAPVCVGAMQDGLLAAAVGWGGEETLREEPLRLHRKGQCEKLFMQEYEDNLLCGGPGPADCGAPLLQADEGRWMLIGIGAGDKTPVARYVRLEPAREWLEGV